MGTKIEPGKGRPASEGEVGFEEPQGASPAQTEGGAMEIEEADSGGFVPPTGEEGEGAEQAAVDAMEEAPIGASLLDMRDQVEQQMIQQLVQAASAGAVSVQEMERVGNIQGVGISEADESLGMEPGLPALTLYVAEPMSTEEIKGLLVDSMGISAASSDDVPVNVVLTGVIDAFTHRFRVRPAPGGVSISHCKVTAGTLGCLARGVPNSTRYNRLLLLSNNHVIANSNNARYGDWIIQPGTYDGGTCSSTRDRIAILERFIRIHFGGPTNYVDCATGWCWPNLVRRELIYRSGSTFRFFRISSQIAACRRGLWVGKTGRTTQLTRGYITDCNATIRVNYGGGRVALFKDQMAVRAPSGNFSAGGDSGSVIWSWDSRRNPVGLLFAGGGGYTFANKMTRVLSALQIILYT